MYNHVILGGTFDHIHRGHEALLRKAFVIGKKVTIGLTSDVYVRNSKISNSNVYEVRNKQLEMWLKKQGIY